ncbi:lytic polysaccharide monooxygenase [Streptomyces sp. NBC_00212]|uniref:lytic polysaccharide monooxygenase n=1 Tax=Streptomyces sp. NBC_00212 TaxID=2975684 RepID=UPI00325037FB
MAAPIFITPPSRQATYLTASQAWLRGGKFIDQKSGGISDPDVPSDIVNREPPRDGQIASAGNPFAFKLDGVRDEFGNEWNASPVRNGDAFTVDITFGGAVKIRRISAYLTQANWDSNQPLTRAQFDLASPVYRRAFSAAPYSEADEEIPVGLVAPTPLTFSFNLPQRSVGHHVVLLEIDHPDSGDATYQVIDLRFVS